MGNTPSWAVMLFLKLVYPWARKGNLRDLALFHHFSLKQPSALKKKKKKKRDPFETPLNVGISLTGIQAFSTIPTPESVYFM